MSPVRLLIVDDSYDVRRMLSAVFEHEPRVVVVGVADGPSAAAALGSRTRPDVALVDVVMPDGGGIRATRLLRTVSPGTAILAFSGATDSNAVLEMLREGATGYVTKSTALDRLVDAVVAVAEGTTVLSSEIAQTVMRDLRHPPAGDVPERRQEALAVERCLRDRRYRPVFQPIVEVASRAVVGYEALTRFDVDGPEEWFARGWRTGHGAELETAVLAEALRQIDRLPQEAFVSVNLSPQTLTDRRVHHLIGDAESERIVVEITEHADLGDPEPLQRALRLLRELGVRVAVDDAGAGFANLVRLLQVVPDIIKLDRILVADIDLDPIKVTIARSLIALARGIGAQLAGEGVEREEEARMLEDLGVSLGQGFLFGRPVPVEAIGVP